MTNHNSNISSMTSAPFPPNVIGANERIILGTVGLRYRGTTVSNEMMKTGDASIVACCDVDKNENQKFKHTMKDQFDLNVSSYHDFRELIDRNDLDAVIIATPDHWHALPFIYSCEAGKDVFVEKPLSHNIKEGRAMVNATKRYQRVVQVGTWQRSIQHFQDAIDFVRSGQLGDIQVCRSWRARNSEGIGTLPSSNPPDHLDWDFWLGPAPYVPYRPNRCHYDWRWHFDYAGGETPDHGAHMLDITCLAMGDWDPLEITSTGGNFVIDDDRDTPDTQFTTFQFKDFVLTWEVRWGNGRAVDGFSSGLGSSWIGTNGMLGVNRGRWETFSEDDRLEKKPETVHEIKTNHFQNFLDCVRTRETPRSDIESSHKTATLCNLASIAYRTGFKLEWDAEREIITNEPSAMNCPQYQREYRMPWQFKDGG